jgi:hypothetical protein
VRVARILALRTASGSATSAMQRPRGQRAGGDARGEAGEGQREQAT